jgi:hypothetical protein
VLSDKCTNCFHYEIFDLFVYHYYDSDEDDEDGIIALVEYRLNIHLFSKNIILDSLIQKHIEVLVLDHNRYVVCL